jgi:predicted unusual protein kinase regulating ubiquinone biosynthesis (AarF/ABC1/UbiB family)
MLTVRALLMSEGAGRMLDPDFNIVEYTRPYAGRLMPRRFDPARQARGLYKLAEEAFALLRRRGSSSRK